MRADRVRNRHLDLPVHVGRTEVADVEVHACPWRIGAPDDVDRLFRELGDATVVFDAQDQASSAGELRASFQRFGGEPDRLIERRARRRVPAENAHVRGAHPLRNLEPLLQLVELLLPELWRRLREADSSPDAVDLDPVAVWFQ